MDLTAVLTEQLQMNPLTWKAMTHGGVTKATELNLDFAYAAPGEQAANHLTAFLQSETDYNVLATSTKKFAPFRKTWSVTGRTKATTLSLGVLNEWVRWMVFAGHENASASSTDGARSYLGRPPPLRCGPLRLPGLGTLRNDRDSADHVI